METALDAVAPFAAIIEADGACRHLGRSLRKVCDVADGPVPRFFELFTISKPMALRGTQDLATACGKKLSLRTSRDVEGSPIVLRASLAPLDAQEGSFLLLTSLGTEMPTLVDPLGLSGGDFAHADPSVDILYLLKTQSALLRDTQALASRLKEAKDAAEALALTDPLTGLPNRRGLGDFVEAILSGSVARDGPAHLLHVDLDRFKQVNDTLGHAAGDAILRRVSEDLSAAIGPNDIAARIGGDEFILILLGLRDVEAAQALAWRLIGQVCHPLEIGNQTAQVGASIGITTIPVECRKSVDSLLIEADLALYDVKSAGRGAVKTFNSELEDREALTQQLIRDIEPAIAAGQFVPYFQVQVDYETGRVFGAEVLGRWEHPEFGMVGPSKFLYVAERAQLVEKIDCSIYEQALDYLVAWQRLGIAPPHISFNVTARKLTSAGFAERILTQISERALDPSQVVFELVETILLDDEADDVRRAAQRLHDAGFALAIDDFGTGRASLSSLLSVPVRILKIDRAFVADLDAAPKKALLTEAIVNIAQALDLQVLAEGIETRSERDTLVRLGCTVFQGYLFGVPQSAIDFEETLRDAAWPDAIPARPQGCRTGRDLVSTCYVRKA